MARVACRKGAGRWPAAGRAVAGRLPAGCRPVAGLPAAGRPLAGSLPAGRCGLPAGAGRLPAGRRETKIVYYEENQRLETRHVGAAKRAFRARLPPILTRCSLKIDVFLRFFLGTPKFATSKSRFRARLPSIFNTSHKLPRLPRNLHLVAT